MWHTGLLDPTGWQLLAITLVLTHITIVSVTVYLHRYSAHRSLELHPALKHFFRCWLWLTTGMNTREWTAVHRKHHAKCETPEDPHSPVQKGLATVLLKGAELYIEETRNEDTLRIYGKNCPDDWIERNLYGRFRNGGIVLMLLINLALFGVLGLTVWAVQMVWIPFWAAGVVNGVGHALGYRNFECRDAATNILPWGILIGGEELHNNHHTYPNSAKLSVKKWEFDMGWAWICLFSLLRLARVRRVAPVPHRIKGKQTLDLDTARALLNNRFQVMAQYRRTVIRPLLQQEMQRVDQAGRRLLRSARRLLGREASLLAPRQQARIQTALQQSQALSIIHERHLALQQIWSRTSSSGHDMAQALRDWCAQAEATRIRVLSDFAAQLRTYSLQPATT